MTFRLWRCLLMQMLKKINQTLLCALREKQKAVLSSAMLRKFDIGASLELDHSQSLSYFVKSTVTIKEPSLKKEIK